MQCDNLIILYHKGVENVMWVGFGVDHDYTILF